MKKVIALSALIMSLAGTAAFAACPCQIQQKSYIAPVSKITYVAPANPCCCKVEPKPCCTGAAAPITQKKSMWDRTKNVYNSTVGTFFTSMLGY